MTAFSIHDVRDSITSDMATFFGRIEDSSRTLASLPLDWPAGPAFEAIGIACHGIAGTTSLVGARSLASTAQVMEQLAEVGKELVAELELQAARARDIAGLCAAGVAALRQMFELELAGMQPEAERLATEVRERIKVASAGDLQVSMRPSSSETASRRDEDATDAPAVPDELRQIFIEEAGEALIALRTLFAALDAELTIDAARPIERILHTLKGAAATVGLREVAELAKSLQTRLAAAIDGEETLDGDLVADLMRDTVWMFELAGLVDVGLARPGVEPRQVFLGEAGRLLAGVIDARAAGGLDRASLAATFHRLEGSALVVGWLPVAKVAAQLKDECQRDDGDDLASRVDRGVQALIELLELTVRDGDAAGSPQPADAHSPAVGSGSTGDAGGSPGAGGVRVRLELALDPELWDAFGQECTELLEQIDQRMFELETSDRPKAILDELMRLYHTLKGAVNTIGLAPVGELVHAVEDFLERLDDVPQASTLRGLVALLLEVQEQVRRALRQAPKGYVETHLVRVRARIEQVLRRQDGAASEASGDWSIADPSELAVSAGPATGSGGSVGDDPEVSERRFIRVPIERLDGLMNLAGELVIGRSRLTGRMALLQSIQRDLGVGRERLIDTVDRFSAEYQYANLDGRRRATRAGPPARAGSAVRSLAGATMSSLVGAGDPNGGFGALELDTYEDVHILARGLTEISSDFNEMDAQLLRELRNFGDDADRLGAIVSSLQGEITRARMVPVESLFARLRPSIREAADRERKDVHVATTGEGVAVDKAIADALLAPMLHLVRNSVGHGIEQPEVRVRRGVSSHGTVTMSARQESGQIVIEIADDGRGLDLDALRAKGVAMGLLAPQITSDDPAVRDLVFATGVTTSSSVGSVSGRGVGGNIVKRAIERLNGNIRVSSSSRGTIFTITLPVTLAITRSVLVRSGGGLFAIPLYFAERILEVTPELLVESAGVRRLQLDDAYLTVRNLDEILGGERTSGAVRSLVVLRVGSDRLALEVDAVTSQEEIVVKPLGPVLEGHAMFAGVTFLGDGQIVYILDVPSLIEAGDERSLHDVTAPSSDFAEAPRTEAVAAPPRAPMPAPQGRLRVLFVDDSISVRKVAERALDDLGVDVVLAVDGIDGIERLRDGQFDLVFTDLEMPRMNGYDLIRELRYVPAHRDLPIVVVSSRSAQKHQDQARSLGATDYLTKPFTQESLARMLRTWTRRGRD